MRFLQFTFDTGVRPVEFGSWNFGSGQFFPEQIPSSRTIYFEIMSYWMDSGVLAFVFFNMSEIIRNLKLKNYL